MVVFFCPSCVGGYAVVKTNATWGRCDACGIKTRLDQVVVWDTWEILNRTTGELSCVVRSTTDTTFGGLTPGFVAYNPRTKEVIY